MAIGRLTPDAPFSLAAMGVRFGPLAAAVAAIGSFAAANAGAIGTAATLAGGAISAMGTLQAGQAAKQNADFQAAQLRQQGTQALASSQRQMFQEQKKTALVQSKLLSNAAASGAGAQDPSVIKLGEDIAGQGEINALTSLGNGLNAMAGDSDLATAKELSGNAALIGSRYSAAGTILGSAGQGFARYAQRMPSPTAIGGWSSNYDINQVGSIG